MSNWKLLNACRKRHPIHGMSTPDDEFNGYFRINLRGQWWSIIASDGGDWQHVSVTCDSAPGKLPPWPIMCAVKELFWEPNDWVVQFHPSRSEYVNNHPACLHLWKPTKQTMPTPPKEFV